MHNAFNSQLGLEFSEVTSIVTQRILVKLSLCDQKKGKKGNVSFYASVLYRAACNCQLLHYCFWRFIFCMFNFHLEFIKKH